MACVRSTTPKRASRNRHPVPGAYESSLLYILVQFMFFKLSKATFSSAAVSSTSKIYMYVLDFTGEGSCSFTYRGCSLHPENVWVDTCLPIAKAHLAFTCVNGLVYFLWIFWIPLL